MGLAEYRNEVAHSNSCRRTIGTQWKFVKVLDPKVCVPESTKIQNHQTHIFVWDLPMD